MNSESMALAERWAGQLVEIHGHGGRVTVPSAVHNTEVITSYRSMGNFHFYVEAIADMSGVVAFRVLDTDDLYLTNIMYGDEQRQNASSVLAAVPGILADSIGLIVDYAVGRPTDANNFEGAGFNYNPMLVQRGGGAGGSPSKLQMFRLEPGIGVRSLFGTYWRSQWWNNTVSQSPHLLGDEMWHFRPAGDDDDDDDDDDIEEEEGSDYDGYNDVSEDEDLDGE